MFIKKHSELEPILEEMGPVLTADEVLQIDEHAFLLKRITGPLTHVCTRNDPVYANLSRDKNYVEKAFYF